MDDTLHNFFDPLLDILPRVDQRNNNIGSNRSFGQEKEKLQEDITKIME
jgi:hypothetical protein